MPYGERVSGSSGAAVAGPVRLAIGSWTVALAGLERAWQTRLRERWGAFASSIGPRPALEVTVRVEGADPVEVLGGWGRGGFYRVEAQVGAEGLEVRSHHFRLLRPAGEKSAWQLRVLRQEDEPAERIVENALRYITAHLAWEAGGLALHAAGVVRGGAAYVFAGPSRSGKTTLVRLSRPCVSLGDDFAVLLPGAEGSWRTTAVPFDNAEQAPDGDPGVFFPVRGLWRIFPGVSHRLERLDPLPAAASLLGCVAFADALPEFEGAMAERVERVARQTGFAQLHFAKDAGFWRLIAVD